VPGVSIFTKKRRITEPRTTPLSSSFLISEITKFSLKLSAFLFKHLHPSPRSKNPSFSTQKGEGIVPEKSYGGTKESKLESWYTEVYPGIFSTPFILSWHAEAFWVASLV
jgi:hypothetical protein